MVNIWSKRVVYFGESLSCFMFQVLVPCVPIFTLRSPNFLVDRVHRFHQLQVFWIFIDEQIRSVFHFH